MIFNITSGCFAGTPDNEVSDFVCAAIQHGHFLQFENGALSAQIENIVNTHGSTTQKKVYLKSRRRSGVAKNVQDVLTIIDASIKTQTELMALAEKPSLVVLENQMEWDVYKHMVDTYKHDPLLKYVLPFLEEAIRRNNLIERHCGGTGEFVRTINAEQKLYANQFAHKALMVIDRDVDADLDAKGNWNVDKNGKNPLYKCLSGKTAATLLPSDIYTLQFPIYVWHMWYRRTIENYFPDRAYVQIGCDLSEFNRMPEDRDYRKIDKRKKSQLSMIGYEKSKLAELTQSMSRADYETGLKHFFVNGQDVSELQLFLLKMFKIV